MIGEETVECALCGEPIPEGEGYRSHTQDGTLCYSCRFDGDNP